jgi:NAD(P)-dependent dehydrogenase (short-subunit alcohol dehydrogenase family)
MLRNITKSPLQRVVIAFGLLFSIILQYPQPKLDISYYTFLAHNHTASQDNQVPLKGVTCVITGATSGLGQDLSKQLFSLGATVIAIGRSESKLSNLATWLLKNQNSQENDEKRIVLVQANLQDLHSVSDAANKIRSKFKTIDFLVNNAGMTHASYGNETESAQGYDMVFAVNYLSHFLLTEKLLPNLQRSKLRNGSRIIQISSSMHLMVNGDDLVPGPGNVSPPWASQPTDSALHRMRSYGNSKLAQIYHARSLAREIASSSSSSSSGLKADAKYSKVKVVSVCPSWVATYIAGSGFKNILDIFAFRSDGYGLASILFAMFHGDVGVESTNNGQLNDYVTNCSILDGKLLSLIQNLASVIPLRYYRETLTWFGGIGLLFFQKAFASVTFRSTSSEGYNIEKQDALYRWSKEAIRPWV